MPGEGGRLEGALRALGAAAGEVEQLVARHADAVVQSISSVRSTVTLPADAHETIAGVADLLGAEYEASLVLRHAPGEKYDEDFCGCAVALTHEGEDFTFSRGGGEWVLVCEAEGRPDPDGYVSYESLIDADVTLTITHPGQLVQMIEQALPLEAPAVGVRGCWP